MTQFTATKWTWGDDFSTVITCYPFNPFNISGITTGTALLSIHTNTRIITMGLTTWAPINITNKARQCLMFFFFFNSTLNFTCLCLFFLSLLLSLQRVNKLSSLERSHQKCWQRFSPFASLHNILKILTEIMRWVVYAVTLNWGMKENHFMHRTWIW